MASFTKGFLYKVADNKMVHMRQKELRKVTEGFGRAIK